MPPKSKPGEGIVIVIDVSPNVRASAGETFYSQAQSCLINILQRKIFTEKCRDMVGIVVFGSDVTNNRLATSNQYQHISVLQEPKFVDWDLINKAKNLSRGNSHGDWLDAIVVAMDLLHDPDGLMFDTKKIVLMTDFNGEFSDDNVETIIAGLKDMNVELSVIGPSIEDEEDLDEPEPSSSNSNGESTSMKVKKTSSIPLNWNGKPKTPQQLAAESLIKRIVAVVEGIICSFDEAIPQLIFFEKKSQGSANWNAMLDIGTDFRIPIVGKIKVKRSTLPSWRKAYAGDESLAILSETSFHKKDEDQTVVENEDVISAYKYGSTLVPFGDEDETLRYVCEAPGAVLSVIGFTSSANAPLTLRAGDQVVVITAKDGDEEGAVALSAIIQALKELNMVAITRRVYRKNLNPSLGALFPEITKDYECLIWIALPFQEEVKEFSFPSLDKVKKKTTQEQRDLMDQLITNMELKSNSDDEDDELLDPEVILNPQIQHYFNCITHRALNPTEPLVEPQHHVLEILHTPSAQQTGRDALINRFKQLFSTQKILDYKQKKKDIFNKIDNSDGASRSAVTTSRGNSSSLSSSDVLNANISHISTATPVQDFYSLLKSDCPNFSDICRQMTNILLQMAESLTGNSSADRILQDKIAEGVKAFRSESVAIDPTSYNAFLRQLKDLVKARDFNVIWTFITQENLGLVTSAETLKSAVTSEEAQNFLQLADRENLEIQEDHNAPEEGVYDDMLDDL